MILSWAASHDFVQTAYTGDTHTSVSVGPPHPPTTTTTNMSSPLSITFHIYFPPSAHHVVRLHLSLSRPPNISSMCLSTPISFLTSRWLGSLAVCRMFGCLIKCSCSLKLPCTRVDHRCVRTCLFSCSLRVTRSHLPDYFTPLSKAVSHLTPFLVDLSPSKSPVQALKCGRLYV